MPSKGSLKVSPVTSLVELGGLLAELNNLKRIRPGYLSGSLAEMQFRFAWSAASNSNLTELAYGICARSIARLNLGGITAAVLKSAGIPLQQSRHVEEMSFDASAVDIEPDLRASLANCLHLEFKQSEPPPFVEDLCRQPRAGATRPGLARLIVLPPESHAEHCLMVAVYGVLLSSRFNADPALTFLAGLSHHLHNAYLPDSGFAGEEMLGELLEAIMKSFQERALRGLERSLADNVLDALRITAGTSTAEGRAFHAADVLDRVLQMKWYEDAAKFTLKMALEEMELVHAGPVREFQMAILQEAQLC